MTEATVTRQGDRGIRVEIPSAEEDPSTISEYLSSPAKLEWKDADGNVVVEGEHVTQAKAGNMDGKWVVSFSLDSEGTAAFAEATANNIGKQLSIYVDDKLISSPTVNSAITGGSGVIEGSFTAESAQELATQIESGALPCSKQGRNCRHHWYCGDHAIHDLYLQAARVDELHCAYVLYCHHVLLHSHNA